MESDETQTIAPDHQPDATAVYDSTDPGTAHLSTTTPDTITPQAVEQEPRSGRHPVNVGHLVMGIAFAGLFVIWALIQSDAVAGSDIRWLLPVPWLAAGAAGLVAVTRSRRTTY